MLVLCGVGGVQSQTITVDRQMKRYQVPRIVFINKMDRPGANEKKVVEAVRNKLRLNAGLVCLPCGRENMLKGLIDVVTKEWIRFEGPNGEKMLKSKEIPKEYVDDLNNARTELFERLADSDDTFAELMMEVEDPPVEDIKAAIKRATIARQFAPVFVGSALKNTGVQHM